ncbi:MAG: hypothetical protein EXR75_14580 [Myxococcales bacterium]|nr:hypothetical protein [Myxococcales bacterium]
MKRMQAVATLGFLVLAGSVGAACGVLTWRDYVGGTGGNSGAGGAGGGGTMATEVCVDTQLDPQHCGACGQACPNAQVRQGGTYLTDCVGGTTKCQDANNADICVNTDLDNAYCGGQMLGRQRTGPAPARRHER